MTEKLYYKNSYIKDFDATVLGCVKNADIYEILLDKTAFFPEGGGQKSDEGYIGDAFVFDVQETENGIVHYSKTAVNINEEYNCKIDWNLRLRRMQQHSGEHIISGLVHSLYGYDNVGFHMEADSVTIDFNGELDRAQLDDIEDRANKAIYDNLSINCHFPDEKTLKTTDYRSKLELTENVRLVEIENIDLCACCAPHVKRTGEIGVIKILDFMRHRGGVRLVAKSGYDALKDYREKYKNIYEISNLLSAKQNETPSAVERVKKELDEAHRELYNFKLSVAQNVDININSNGNVSYFISNNFDSDMLRTVVNSGMNKTRLCIAFSGSDSEGYSYIAGSLSLDMKNIAKLINTKLFGRGGGRDTMIQGKLSAVKEQITEFLQNIDLGEIENG